MKSIIKKTARGTVVDGEHMDVSSETLAHAIKLKLGLLK